MSILHFWRNLKFDISCTEWTSLPGGPSGREPGGPGGGCMPDGGIVPGGPGGPGGIGPRTGAKISEINPHTV